MAQWSHALILDLGACRPLPQVAPCDAACAGRFESSGRARSSSKAAIVVRGQMAPHRSFPATKSRPGPVPKNVRIHSCAHEAEPLCSASGELRLVECLPRWCVDPRFTLAVDPHHNVFK